MTKPIAQRPYILENLDVRYATAREVATAESICIKHYRRSIVTDGKRLFLDTGGMTVAYRRNPGDSFVEVATALCSVRDIYNKKMGTTLAVEAFMNDRVVRLPLYGATPESVIAYLFGRLHTAYVE